ncbi:MAG: zinc ribbon domain-containing protein [Fuerstiella sp.]
MPLFEFQCSSCDSEFELLVAAKEKPACPECDSKKLEKLMSASVGRVSAGASLPIANSDCPPPEAGPCGTSCCRLP